MNLNDKSKSKNQAAQPNVISHSLLNARLPQKDPEKFRHSYQLRDGDDYLDKDCFRVDVIELPKLTKALDKLPARQRIWIRLFLAQSYAEVRQLATEEPLFRKVCEVLEVISKDKKMQDRARMIWEGEFAVQNAKYLEEKERREQERKRQEEDKKQQEEKRKLEEELVQVRTLAEHANAKAIQAEAKAESERFARITLEEQSVRAFAANGQSSESIAAQLNLTPERINEILKTFK